MVWATATCSPGRPPLIPLAMPSAGRLGVEFGFKVSPYHSSTPSALQLNDVICRRREPYPLLALKLPRYQRASPGTLWRDFLDATCTLNITENDVICAPNLRSHHPTLIDAFVAG